MNTECISRKLCILGAGLPLLPAIRHVEKKNSGALLPIVNDTIYAPGYSDGNQLNLSFIREITGINVELGKDMENSRSYSGLDNCR